MATQRSASGSLVVIALCTVCLLGTIQAEELAIGELLAASGCKPGEQMNCLVIGPGALETALAAGRLEGIRAYLVAEPGPALDQARAAADAAGLLGATVFAREAALKDTLFPDFFFQRVVVLGQGAGAEAKELWRVTRPSGKILLNESAANLKFEGAPDRSLPGGFGKWREIARPTRGAEWPMKGGFFHANTTLLSYCSPDAVIKPPLKLLWLTRGTGPSDMLAAGGRVYGVQCDAYTGQTLKQKGNLPGPPIAAWQNVVLVEDKSKKTLVAYDVETGQEQWQAPGLKFLGVTADYVVCEGSPSSNELVFLDKTTGKAAAGPPGGVVRKEKTKVDGATAPDGTVYKRGDPFLIRPPGSEKWEPWFVAPGGMHSCSLPVLANGYMWAIVVPEIGLGVFKLSQRGDAALTQAWFHSLGCHSCANPVVAFGNLYFRANFSGFALCLASGEPYPEQLRDPVKEPLERGEPPVSGPGGYDPEDWPMLQYDAAHTGASPDRTIRAPLQVLWAAPLGAPVATAPAVAGGLVFAGLSSGKFCALDAKTGAIRWTYFTGDEIHGSPCVWGGMVYFGSDDGWIYCLNATSGKLIWRRAVDRHHPETPSLSGVIPSDFPLDFLDQPEKGARNQCVSRFCLDGKPKLGPGIVRGSPLVAEGRLYIGSGLGVLGSFHGSPFWGCLYCLDARTGELVWKRATQSGVDYAPAFSHGRVFIVEECLEALDSATGKPRSFTNPCLRKYNPYEAKPPRLAISLAGDRTFLAIDVNEKRGTLTACVSLIDGSTIGVGPPGGHVPCPALAGGVAYCADGGGNIVLYPTSGYETQFGGNGRYLDLVQKGVLRAGARVPPVCANGLLFCGGNDNIDVVDLPTGKPVSSVRLGGGISAPFAVSRGRLYAGANDGKIYCLGQ